VLTVAIVRLLSFMRNPLNIDDVLLGRNAKQIIQYPPSGMAVTKSDMYRKS
jgi:hypothetical protein